MRSTRRRPLARAAAIATAAAFGATALAVAPASAADVPLKDYTLEWGLKESYRSYVTGIAMGKITVADGAQQAAKNGPFTFVDGTGSYDSGKHTVKLAFKGRVTFTSKAHGFEVALSDIRFDSAAKRVTADVSRDGGKAEQDVPLAEVSVTRDMKAMTTKLTEQADKALGGGGRYTGAAGDPLTVAEGGGTGTPSPDPTDPTPPASPSPSSPAPTQKPTQKPTASPSTPATPTAKPTPTPTPPPAEKPSGPATPGEVVDGRLSWGLKESFRRYISSGGEVRTADGAKKQSDGYQFPYAKGDLDAGAKKLTASFGGSVQFLYKAHGIDMKFSDVKIRANGAKGTLLVDVTTPKGTNDDVEFATLDLSKVSYAAKNDVVRLDKVPAAFTADGARQFANDTTGSMYKAGDPIDPVTVALTLSEDATLPGTGGGSGDSGGSGTVPASGGGSVGGSVGGGSGSLAATGAGLPTGALLGAAGAVAAAGAAAVYAARRRAADA